MDKLLSQLNPLPSPSLTDILYAINSTGTQEGKRTIQELANLFGLLTFRVSLTAAQIRTAFSIPVLAVAAPGLGKAIQVISASVKFIANTTPYGGGCDDFKLQIDTATNPQALTTNIILQNGVNDFVVLSTINAGGQTNTMIEDEALNITSNGDSVGGDGTAIIYGTYRIITL